MSDTTQLPSPEGEVIQYLLPSHHVEDVESLHVQSNQRCVKAGDGAYLNSSMTAEVKVKLIGMGDVGIDCGAGRDVPTPSNLRRQGTTHLVTKSTSSHMERSDKSKAFPHPLVTVSTEKASVVPFLHNDKRDARLVLSLQAYTGFPDGQQLVIQHLIKRSNSEVTTHNVRSQSVSQNGTRRTIGRTADLSELSLRHPVSVEDETCGFVACGFVELDEQLADHRAQILDDLLPGPLYTYRGAVTARVSVHAAHHLSL